jgi:hypothetical protein
MIQPDPNRKEDIRALLFHVNNVLHTRVNLLLVAEAIFFAAIAQLWGKQGLSIKLLVCALGGTVTLMLWYSNATLLIRSNYLTEELKKVDAVYSEYMDAVSNWLRKKGFPRENLPYVTPLLVHGLPLVMLVAWILIVGQLLASL